jgi:myosin heavy subunit
MEWDEQSIGAWCVAYGMGGYVCVVFEQIQFCYRNPTAVEGTDDFLTLPHLDEPNILHSLRVRYNQGHVYSYTGPILIAVNPWRQVYASLSRKTCGRIYVNRLP